jgi:hypothetical protein
MTNALTYLVIKSTGKRSSLFDQKSNDKHSCLFGPKKTSDDKHSSLFGPKVSTVDKRFTTPTPIS